MKVSETLDSCIKQMPPKHNGMYFIISKILYKQLCIELKRNVKTYKGYKIRQA